MDEDLPISLLSTNASERKRFKSNRGLLTSPNHIKMRRIDPATGKLSTTDTQMYSLSSRPREQPIGGSVEAPFIIRHGKYWYLFVSFDRCCRGARSTYNVVVGRSKSVTGPYVDKDGTPMTDGGGTLVIEATTPNWRGAAIPLVAFILIVWIGKILQVASSTFKALQQAVDRLTAHTQEPRYSLAVVMVVCITLVGCLRLFLNRRGGDK